MHQVLCVALLSTVGFAAAPAFGHDFWITPSAFNAKAGERINLGLRVGHLDTAEDVVRDITRIEQFVVFAPDGTKTEVAGQEGKSPAGVIRPQSAGWNIVAFDSNNARSKLDAERFETYLKEEGLERIVEERRKRGESSAAGIEDYSRCAKALLRIEGAVSDSPSIAASQVADRAVGLRFELVADRSPSEVAAGTGMPIIVLFDGKPIEGVKVVAANLANASDADSEGQVVARSDSAGRATLTLPVAGMWLIHAVYSTRLPDEAEADWETVFTSLTFEIVAR